METIFAAANDAKGKINFGGSEKFHGRNDKGGPGKEPPSPKMKLRSLVLQIEDARAVTARAVILQRGAI